MTESDTTPTIVPVGDDRPKRELRRRVRDLLAAGELVGVPTETVYGIAARADDPAAIERLARAKRRSPDDDTALVLTWHVASRAPIDLFGELQPLARRLAARYWPGPLTLVLHGVPDGLALVGKDGWTGVRLPAHRALQGLIDELDFPIVASSANLTGEPPQFTAEGVARVFGGDVALVVDGGPARIAEASGVLRVGRGHFDLLREGLLPVEDLRRVAGLRIAFVCTGNTCRSPMAEGIARALLEDRLGVSGVLSLADFGFELASMGVSAGPGMNASAHAVEVLAARGIDIRGHRSSAATPERLAEFDEILCLTGAHRAALIGMLPPSARKRIHVLDRQGRDVADPIGGSRAIYAECAAQIEQAIAARLDGWA